MQDMDDLHDETDDFEPGGDLDRLGWENSLRAYLRQRERDLTTSRA